MFVLSASATSDPPPAHIIEDTGVVPVVNQVELHPRSPRRSAGVCTREPDRPGGVESVDAGQSGSTGPRADCGEIRKTTAQVILRWDIQNGVIVIPKSVKEHRIRENADIFDFELSAEDMATIDGLNQNKRFGSNPDEFLF